MSPYGKILILLQQPQRHSRLESTDTSTKMADFPMMTSSIFDEIMLKWLKLCERAQRATTIERKLDIVQSMHAVANTISSYRISDTTDRALMRRVLASLYYNSRCLGE